MTKLSTVRALAALSLLLSAGACASLGIGTGAEIASQSEEYDRLVAAKGTLGAEMRREARPGRAPVPSDRPVESALARGPEGPVADTELRFLDLAARAAESARRAQGRDRPLAAAHYRIALLSNWQAGKAGHRHIVQQSEEAAENCAKMNPAPPRDCALTVAVRQVVIVDSETVKLRALDVATDTGRKNNTPENRAAFLGMFSSIADAFDKLERQDLRALPDSYVTWTRQQQGVAYCNGKIAFTTYERMRTPADQESYRRADRRRAGMQSVLKDAGVPPGC